MNNLNHIICQLQQQSLDLLVIINKNNINSLTINQSNRRVAINNMEIMNSNTK